LIVSDEVASIKKNDRPKILESKEELSVR
jgi:hypothetical protein